MTPTRKKRLIIATIMLMGVSIATALILSVWESNIMFFKSPTDIINNAYPENRNFRVGGMVKKDSLTKATDSLKVKFIVTDHQNDVTIHYQGLLPDLFREGQGVVAIGRMDKNVFIAEEILAKHDENYMPPEVANHMKEKI